MSNRDILVVFDIDETLIQFVNKKAYHFWEEITPEQKQIIDDKIPYVDFEKKRQVIFLRPCLKEFLEMALKTRRIKVALWTYSEHPYAEEMAQLICKKFGLPDDMFVFTYNAEDIEDETVPKSLEQIWRTPKFRNFNKFNTILVDDRYGNLAHNINKKNSILVQAFAPFGETKSRETLTDELLTKAINDNIFNELSHITSNLIKYIDGCEDEEIEEAIEARESIFEPKTMKKKHLENYIKEYKNNVKLFTIGEVENADSSIKGGERTKTNKLRIQKTHKYRKYGKNTRKNKNKRNTRKI